MKNFKKFSFYAQINENWEYSIVKVEGRDVYDAYKKALNKYEFVRKPYKDSNKYIRKELIKKARQKDINYSVSKKDYKYYFGPYWVEKYMGVVIFD